jgi:hypothetical protein
MARRSVLGVLGVAALVFSSAACGEIEETSAREEGAVLAANALTANALTANALTANALTANALTANALTANALTANALTANGLKDPLGRELLKYVVSCALPASAEISISVDGERFTFRGSLGLAAEWGREGGVCDGACQRWVSACVLARVDDAGVERIISVRGEHKELRMARHEVRDYSVREATYYGNLFKPSPERYFCLSPDQSTNTRVCGPSLANCPMTVVGSCADACRSVGAHMSFQRCSSTGQRNRGETFAETITVFLSP